MKGFWWKILTVGLLLYVIIFSFVVPLSPDISRLSTSNLKIGPNKVTATGYNTSFNKYKGNISGYVSYEKKALACLTNIEVVNDQQITFEVDIPSSLPAKNIHLNLHTTGYSIFAPEIIKVFDAEKTEKVIEVNCSSPLKSSNEAMTFPNRLLLNETIRNLMFHVPMWFTMMVLLFLSFISSIRYLRGFDLVYDLKASQAVNIGLLFAVLGIVTGAIWAKFTWSDHTPLLSLNGWWANDVKLNGAAISTLIYIAYRILRSSIQDEHQRAKVSAVYNIFAFVLMIVFIMILPRIYDSLHPGNGGNPAFGAYDLDNTLRMVFYPAVIGWILLGAWILQLKIRLEKLNNAIHEAD